MAEMAVGNRPEFRRGHVDYAASRFALGQELSKDARVHYAPRADAELEEARRLFYVGITRVKADPKRGRRGTLVITYPLQMPAAEALKTGIAFHSKTGDAANLIASRFIEELGDHRPHARMA